jgi:glycosyltransferase involved in cell wall biosynthesis
LEDSVVSLQWAYWNPKAVAGVDVVVATAWHTAERLGPDPRGIYLLQHYEIWGGVQERVDATWRLGLQKIVISEWLRDKARELGAGEATVVPNAIDLNVFNLDVPPERRSPDEVAMMWHKMEWKGSAEGLEALRIVKVTRPNLHVTLFAASRKPRGMPDWVTYVQNANESQLRAIYNRAAVLISPSHSEGWALPPAEAMACGAAVVTTDNGGVRDYAKNHLTAMITRIRDPEAMAKAIIELLNDHSRRYRIALAGHELMANKYNWATSTDLFEEVLLDRISGANGES